MSSEPRLKEDLERLQSENVRLRAERDVLSRELEEARERESWYRRIVESAGEGVCVIDDRRRARFVNPRLAEMLGSSAEDLVGRRVMEVIQSRDEGPDLLDLGAQAASSAVSGDLLLRRKDGTDFWAAVSANPLTGPEGGALAVVRDVSGRREVEEELRSTKEFLTSLLENANGVIFALDMEGRLRLVNRTWEQYTNVTRAEAVGQRIEDIFPGEPAARTEARRQNVIATGTPSTYTTPVNLPMGPRWFQTVMFPIRGADGEIDGVGGISLDITEQRNAHLALKETHETLRVLIDSAPVAIFAVDEHERVTLWNPAAERIFGWTEEEVKGQPLPYVPDFDMEDFRARLDASRGGAHVPAAERRRLRKDGSLVDISILAAPLLGADGEPRGSMAIVADISDRKRMEQQLLQAQKMEGIGRLAGGVAHDFNNLLTAMIGFMEMAQTQVRQDATAAGWLQQARVAAERAADLTGQLLAFARKQVIEPRVLDLNELIRDVNRLLERLLGEDIEIATRLVSNLGHVKADPTQIEQVLINLAVNARDAMPRGGKLIIETQNIRLGAEDVRRYDFLTPGDYALIAVSDNGAGIPRDVLPHVFEPFFTTKEQGKGTGLGLATCYGIVKQSGGHIWVYSEEGIGTTFKVCLPCVADAATNAEEPQDPDAGRAGGETILLVEDEELVRSVAAHALRSKGYAVLEAANGPDALALIEREGVRMDLLVTDVVMPRMSGPDLAARLEDRLPGLKVLYTSGYTGAAIVEHGVLHEGLSFLQKPFTPSSLAAKVREVLDAPASSSG
jgi:PAS domain S-box-containing protein